MCLNALKRLLSSLRDRIYDQNSVTLSDVDALKQLVEGNMSNVNLIEINLRAMTLISLCLL